MKYLPEHYYTRIRLSCKTKCVDTPHCDMELHVFLCAYGFVTMFCRR